MKSLNKIVLIAALAQLPLGLVSIGAAHAGGSAQFGKPGADGRSGAAVEMPPGMAHRSDGAANERSSGSGGQGNAQGEQPRGMTKGRGGLDRQMPAGLSKGEGKHKHHPQGMMSN